MELENSGNTFLYCLDYKRVLNTNLKRLIGFNGLAIAILKTLLSLSGHSKKQSSNQQLYNQKKFIYMCDAYSFQHLSYFSVLCNTQRELKYSRSAFLTGSQWEDQCLAFVKQHRAAAGKVRVVLCSCLLCHNTRSEQNYFILASSAAGIAVALACQSFNQSSEPGKHKSVDSLSAISALGKQFLRYQC